MMNRSTEITSSFDDILSSGNLQNGKSSKSSRRPSAHDVASRAQETLFGSKRKRRVVATGVGVLGIWSFLGYNKEAVPSPSETVNATINGVQWIIATPDRAWGEHNSSGASPNSAPLTSPTTIGESTDTTVAATSGNLTNLVPVVTQATASTATTLAITQTTLSVQEHLPPVVEYSAAAGSVMCNGEEKSIHIDTASDVPPLTQIAEQTGEPWNLGQPNSNADTILYQEASRGMTDFYVRLGCVGLEN